MSRVMTFSRVFPAYHPKAREETKFVEQIYNSIGVEYWKKLKYLNIDQINENLILSSDEDIIGEFWRDLDQQEKRKKLHTIRAGKNWKVGDKFSPRVWSGKPYNSKQIVIAPDIGVKKVYDIEIDDYEIFLDRAYWGNTHSAKCREILDNLSKNDGLSYQDMLDWFKVPCQFRGQIICWGDVEY